MGLASVLLGALVACAGPVPAQVPVRQLEVDLRDGRTLVTEQVTGTPGDGLELLVAGRRQKVAIEDVVAVRGGAARAPELLRVQLVGGERLFGAIHGGDENGDRIEVLSPVFGQIEVAIDRLAAVVQPGVEDADQRLPDGVDEGVFLPTGRGYDLVAGTLYRFGPDGVRFQPEAAEAPQWFSSRRFSSVRLRGGFAREQASQCTLLTRTADRLGVALVGCDADGLDLTLETGAKARVRWIDVASLVFHRRLVHLADLEPAEVSERGFDGPAVHPFRRDRSCVGTELMSQGRAYGRGLGVHSRSRLVYRAPENATHFRARVAIDDSAAELPVRADASVRVLRDGEVVFEAEGLRPGAAPRDVGLHAVEPGQTIELEVDFGAGRALGDRVDWLLPMFLLRSDA